MDQIGGQNSLLFGTGPVSPKAVDCGLQCEQSTLVMTGPSAAHSKYMVDFKLKPYIWY